MLIVIKLILVSRKNGWWVISEFLNICDCEPEVIMNEWLLNVKQYVTGRYYSCIEEFSTR